MFGVTILGCNSALPILHRRPTSQIVIINEDIFLIDCGEGTQWQMLKYKIRRSKINHIFISHLHGDHYFGLIGLLTTYALMSRKNPIHIYSPAPLENIILTQLSLGHPLPYPLHFHVLSKADVILETKESKVTCFPTEHGTESYGFTFTEKREKRKINYFAIKRYNIPFTSLPHIQRGENYIDANGNCIKNDLITYENKKPRMYSFVSDTRWDPSIIPFIQNSNLLYHETTYLKEMKEKATMRFHSTTHQAGEIAKLSNAELLIIGHFSSMYEDISVFLKETQEVFTNVALGEEGVSYRVLDY